MAIITYPLNDVDYTAEDAETYLCTRTSGVYAAESFPATVTEARKITIGTGMAWINNGTFKGKSVVSTENVSVAIPIADGALPRIDRIVLRFTKSTNESTFEVKTGTPASSPVAPTLTRSELLYELGLYTVSVPAGSLTVSAADVTNTMLDENVCGLMRDGVTGLPTGTLQQQYEALIKSMTDEIAAIKVGSATMLKDVYDPSGLGTSATVQVYSCAKTGNTFALTGSGAVGRFKAPATFTSGDAFSINGKAVPAYVGANAVDADTIVKDRWVLFTYDGTQLNFNGGGGLGANKLALATADADDVLEGDTYYAKDKTLKKGTLKKRGSVTSPVSFGVADNKIYVRINEGAYKEKSSAGYPEISFEAGSAPASAVLEGNNFTSASAGVNVGGSMPNKGSWGATLSPGGVATIPSGFHDGNGQVTVRAAKLRRKVLGTLNTNRYEGPFSATFSVTDLPGWQSFTTENFAFSDASVTANAQDQSTGFSYSLSYNPNSGIVTVTNNYSYSGSPYFQTSGTVTCVCYYAE
jgi:hypothetical protein